MNCLPLFNYRNERIREYVSPLLSRRQAEIFCLAASGFSSQDIATELFIGKRTVDKHREVIRRKLAGTGLIKMTRRRVGFGSHVWLRHWLDCMGSDLNLVRTAGVDAGSEAETRLLFLIREIETVCRKFDSEAKSSFQK